MIPFLNVAIILTIVLIIVFLKQFTTRIENLVSTLIYSVHGEIKFTAITNSVSKVLHIYTGTDRLMSRQYTLLRNSKILYQANNQLGDNLKFFSTNFYDNDVIIIKNLDGGPVQNVVLDGTTTVVSNGKTIRCFFILNGKFYLLD